MPRQPTSDLAHFCATLRGDELPDHARERVRYLLLDHLAVTLRGSRLPARQAAYSMLQPMRATGSTGASTIFGRPERAEASWAAFANGVAAHGLEMDDVENASSLHPGVVVMPAALALAEQLGSPAAAFYPAVVPGHGATLPRGAPPNPSPRHHPQLA